MQETVQMQATPSPCLEAPPDGLLRGVAEFNRGEFYDCHDTLEGLWMAETRPVRSLYQGILQIGVAFYHLRAGRYRSVAYLLERGSVYLQPLAPVCMGIDLDSLLADASVCLQQVQTLGPERLDEFDWTLIPQIRIRT